jgi:dolichol-phosphate mannosyltransferase
MLALSVDAFTGFSTAPLRVATALGLGGAVVAVLFGVYVVVNRIVGNPTSGWASMVVVVVTIGAVQLLCLGLLGEYIARMYIQMQGRPAYYIAYDSLADRAPQSELHGSSPPSPAEETLARPPVLPNRS